MIILAVITDNSYVDHKKIYTVTTHSDKGEIVTYDQPSLGEAITSLKKYYLTLVSVTLTSQGSHELWLARMFSYGPPQTQTT